ncbi:uncharacterized protein SRS1_16293 [Sporisorium reilianum f. sp. reilianum]|uniref:Uncharacterized protein n=1 Tax=Sporisorium reilianum f. sp. reilianum TaxID=72559 RepID=A0A2N8UL76_9BASI|nr:uncharacterized protein SRS1_16293 [Sporisorium reilianum f. sp. reilianum]
MGRLTQGHFDDVFLNKLKQACLHVLDQLNDDNEIDQAFDLCPSISRRNRVILSFLRDADHIRSNHAGPSTSNPPPLPTRLPVASIRPSRNPPLVSLSAQRRRRAREMQYVRDPNDSNDDSDSQATLGPSTSSRTRLDPSSAHNPSMSQPDYTFEQFAEHLDPADKLLKRSLEIIIKETARQALASKRDPNFDPDTASASSSRDPAASLRSAIASSHTDRTPAYTRSRDDSAFARRMSRVLNIDSPSTSRAANPAASADLDHHTYQLLRSIGPVPYPSITPTSTDPSGSATFADFWRRSAASYQDLPASASWASRLPSTSATSLPIRLDRETQSSAVPPHSLLPQPTQRRSAPRPPTSTDITPQTISERLAEASRRNAQAARTIGEAERLRSSQFIRTSIESLRASLFQLHMDLACTQLQQAQREQTPPQHDASSVTENIDIGASYALVMDTIELFDDILRRLSCLVSNTARDDHAESTAPAQGTTRNANSSRMRTSLWRARNLLLVSSMIRRPHDTEAAHNDPASSNSTSDPGAELRAHRHLLATIEESHWARADAPPPCTHSIRTWRRKLAAWYHLDRDPAQFPDAPQLDGDREEPYARWNPDLELPYPLDDEIMAPMTADAASARPHPITDPRAAWDYARRHDDLLRNNLNDDEQVREALASNSVASALQHLLQVRNQSAQPTGAQAADPPAQNATSAGETPEHSADRSTADADPDVSLTRTTSLSRRNAVRGLPLTNSDASSLRSARSSLSLRRPPANTHPSHSAVEDDNDAIEEDVVETSIEIGTVPQTGSSASDTSLLAPSERPRAGRSGSFTFITTPAAVLRSRQRSESRSQGGQRTASPATAPGEDDEEALEERNSEAEEYIDLDLDLGMAGEGAFDFDLVDFLRSESRLFARRHNHDDVDPDGAESSFAVASPPRLRRRRRARDDDDESEPSDSASPTGIRVFVSGSGASTPAEARQATFEAYAQRARLLERRRRMERQRQESETEAADAGSAQVGGGNESEETSPQSRRRRRARGIGAEGDAAGSQDPRNSLPFPSRTSER